MGKIKCGMKVKDKISGFEGIVTTICEHIAGCFRVGVMAGLDKDGKLLDVEYFDEPMLEVIQSKPVAENTNPNSGGPMTNADPGRPVDSRG